MPPAYTFTASGFSGSAAGLNGTWTVSHTEGCTFASGDGETVPYWHMTANGSLFGEISGDTVSFAPDEWACCGPVTYSADDLGGTTYSGGSITLTPVGDCPPPPPPAATWDCEDGTCVERDDGSGEFPSAGACVADGCDPPPDESGSQACCPGSPKMTTGQCGIAVTSGACDSFDAAMGYMVYMENPGGGALYFRTLANGASVLIACNRDGTWMSTITYEGVVYHGMLGAEGAVCEADSISMNFEFLFAGTPCSGSIRIGAAFTP